METPNGSIEELCDKCNKVTAEIRGYLYTFLRRRYLKAYRVQNPDQAYSKPCQVFTGKEWLNAIQLKDKYLQDLTQRFQNEEFYGKAHMYRFDETLKIHVLDEIMLYKDKKFPPAYTPFSDPEPIQDHRMESRNAYEAWNQRRLIHEQSDSAQFNLIKNKINAQEESILNLYNQLQETIKQISTMNKTVYESISPYSIEELKKLVKQIPLEIKQMRQNIQEKSGIIVKDTDIKLTPVFLSQLGTADREKEKEKIEKENAIKTQQQQKDITMNNAKDFNMISFAGVPIEKVLDLFSQKQSDAVSKSKAAKRFTMW